MGHQRQDQGFTLLGVPYHQPLLFYLPPMPFRFFQRFRIAPGLTLNVSKGGVSVSAGPRGAKFTMGTRGTRATAGLPGTGLHYTVLNPHKKVLGINANSAAAVSPTAVVTTPQLGWLQRLTLPKAYQAFVKGWQAWARGQNDQALALFSSVPANAASGPDAAWSAALLHTQQEHLAQAADLLMQALHQPDRIGRAFAHHQISPRVHVPVTPDVQATMTPTANSARLLLAEVQQSLGQSAQARQTLHVLLPNEPQPLADPVVMAAFGELAIQTHDVQATDTFLLLAAAMGNDTPVHTVVMLYRAQALFAQGHNEAALAVLSPALRRTKDRNPDLLNNIRHLRAQVYTALGRKAQARADMARIEADDPGFEGLEHNSARLPCA